MTNTSYRAVRTAVIQYARGRVMACECTGDMRGSDGECRNGLTDQWFDDACDRCRELAALDALLAEGVESQR